MVDTLSKHKDVWVEVMMIEELGINDFEHSPLKNSMVTFISFVLFGLIPLLPFIIAKII